MTRYGDLVYAWSKVIKNDISIGQVTQNCFICNMGLDKVRIYHQFFFLCILTFKKTTLYKMIVKELLASVETEMHTTDVKTFLSSFTLMTRLYFLRTQTIYKHHWTFFSVYCELWKQLRVNIENNLFKRSYFKKETAVALFIQKCTSWNCERV